MKSELFCSAFFVCAVCYCEWFACVRVNVCYVHRFKATNVNFFKWLGTNWANYIEYICAPFTFLLVIVFEFVLRISVIDSKREKKYTIIIFNWQIKLNSVVRTRILCIELYNNNYNEPKGREVKRQREKNRIIMMQNIMCNVEAQ